MYFSDFSGKLRIDVVYGRNPGTLLVSYDDWGGLFILHPKPTAIPTLLWKEVSGSSGRVSPVASFPGATSKKAGLKISMSHVWNTAQHFFRMLGLAFLYLFVPLVSGGQELAIAGLDSRGVADVEWRDFDAELPAVAAVGGDAVVQTIVAKTIAHGLGQDAAGLGGCR
jgi:hypothetical protein